MDVRRILGSAPRELRLGEGGGEASYELADDIVAVHGEHDGFSVESLTAVAQMGLDERLVGPVYRQARSGGLAVPTGRVFVRFAETDAAARHEQALAEAGYEVEGVPSYAPHAAWLRATGGTVGDALGRLEDLQRLPAVEHAEPQLLTVAARR